VTFSKRVSDLNISTALAENSAAWSSGINQPLTPVLTQSLAAAQSKAKTGMPLAKASNVTLPKVSV